MGRAQTVPVYMRSTGAAEDVDNSGYTEVALTAPQQCKIRRIRAEFAAGSVGTQIGLQVREATGISLGLPVIVAYALTPTNIDSLEDIYGASVAVDDPATGTLQYVLYVAVTTNGAVGSADTINLSIDFEACA